MLKPLFASYGSLDAASVFQQIPDGSETITRVVEGGYLGLIEGTAGVQFPYVDVAGSDAGVAPVETTDANYPLLGLIDDSSTGSGYGTLIGSMVAGAQAAEAIGPSTHYASNRLTIWTNPGIFLTDVLDPGLVDGYGEGAVAVGTALYWDSTNLYWTNVSANHGRAMATFLAIVGDENSDEFVPRVQPLPTGTQYLVFKFKGFVA